MINRRITAFARALRVQPEHALKVEATVGAEPFLGSSFYAPLSEDNNIEVVYFAGRIPAGTVLRDVTIGAQVDGNPPFNVWFEAFDAARWAALVANLNRRVSSLPIGSGIDWLVGSQPLVETVVPPAYAQQWQQGQDPDVARPDAFFDVLEFVGETTWIAQATGGRGGTDHFAWSYRELDR